MATRHLVWSSYDRRERWSRRVYASFSCHVTPMIQSQLITDFFDFQVSRTQLLTVVLTSTSLQSEQTADTMETSPRSHSSYHPTPKTLSTLPIARYTCLWELENKSLRAITARHHITRITTVVRLEGDREFPSPRSTLTTLTAFLQGPRRSIGTP